MERQDALEEAIRLLHDARQPLNVMSLSCANIRARNASGAIAMEPEQLLVKIAKIEQQIEKEAGLLNAIRASLVEAR